MLKCKDIAHKSSDFVDKKLNRKERLYYYLHLFMCGHCRRYIAQFRRFVTLNKQSSIQTISDAEVDSIVAAVKKEAKK